MCKPCDVEAADGASHSLSNEYQERRTPNRMWLASILLVAITGLMSCRSAQRDPKTVVFLIESSPTNLDPRVGTDGQSEHIDELLFDGLVAHDANFHFTPALAES